MGFLRLNMQSEQKRSVRRTAFISFALLAAAIVAALIWNAALGAPRAGLTAADALLDMRGYDMEKSGSANIVGGIGFFPYEHISAADEVPPYYLDFSGRAEPKMDEAPVDAGMWGTFYLRILPPENGKTPLLVLPQLFGEHIVYANGEEIGRAGADGGNVSRTRSSLMKARYLLPAGESEIELFIYFAGVGEYSGGFSCAPMILGLKQAEAAISVNVALRAFIAAIMGFMALLAVLIPRGMLEKRSFILFGGACFSSMLIVLFEADAIWTPSGDWSAHIAGFGMGLLALFAFLLFAEIGKEAAEQIGNRILRFVFAPAVTKAVALYLLLLSFVALLFFYRVEQTPLYPIIVWSRTGAMVFGVFRIVVCALHAQGRLDIYLAPAFCYAATAAMSRMGGMLSPAYPMNPISFGGIIAEGILFMNVAGHIFATNRQLSRWSEELEARVRVRTRELNIANERLRAAEKERQEMFETIAHDLRSPLTSAMGAVEVLRNLDDPEDRRRMLAVAHSRMEQLSEMTAALFYMVRISSGAEPLKLAPHDLRTFTEQIAEFYRTELLVRGEKRRIETAVDQGPPIYIMIDYDKLIEIADNLMVNALRHSPNGSVIQFGYVRVERKAMLYLSNEGEGVPPDTVGKIFDRFFRAQENGKDGAGIGLSIVRTIVEKHGGKVWAENVEGGFRVCMLFDTLSEAEALALRESDPLQTAG